MSDDTFFRYPHTPHLLWLGDAPPRADKVLSPQEAEAFLEHEVTVEEKVDGANVGLSVDGAGGIRAQNRGAYVTREACHPQFRPLFRWLDERRQLLLDHLPPRVIVFGEWCYAVHSVRYTRLPDWFLMFDVFDLETASFWSMARRNELADSLDLARVPHVRSGRLVVDEIASLPGQSSLTDGPSEGVYLKWSAGGGVRSRAKVVRASFVQGIDTHWTARTMQVNALAPDRETHR